MEENEGGCFEGSAELMDFFRKNENMFTEGYEALLKIERPRDAARQKNCAYFAAQEVVFKSGRTATDCQINRIAEILCFGFPVDFV